MILEAIDSPRDLKGLSKSELTGLAAEIREALVARAGLHGGHLGSNLGIVETTLALHYVFDSPADKIVFDVSHQTYPHKMVTGRKEAFLDPAHYDDVSGFSSPDESPHDPFVLGHTSTSVSLAAGMAKARDLLGGTENVVAVIGDGSLSGGEAFEGLDIAGELDSNFIVVVNDNEMSIAENHGAIYRNLAELRDSNGTARPNVFRSLGFDYRYVANGNSVDALVDVFAAVKDCDHPVVVHVHTRKGCGYGPAERDREAFHNIGPIDVATGRPKGAEAPSYREVTAEHLTAKMEADPAVVAICAGTPTGLGFTPDLRERAAGHFIDVGIAEASAVTLGVGMAARGAKPVVCIYSTFLPRALDQVCQELCINDAHVTMVVDRGSVYGMNDVTHLGLTDIPLLSNIPGLTYLAPATQPEYLRMLDWAIDEACSPVAVKVPGGNPVTDDLPSVVHGSKVALVGAGTFFTTAMEAAAILEREAGLSVTVVNPQVVSEVSDDLCALLVDGHDLVVTLEDGMIEGGYGSKVATALADSDVKVVVKGLAKELVDRYKASELLEQAGLTARQVADDVLSALGQGR